MTTPQAIAAPAKTMRLIHAAMISGVLLFALVAHFQLRPTMTAPNGMSAPGVERTMLGVALGLCAVALLLRRRVPRRSAGVSADSYWSSDARQAAMLMWAPLEGACLSSVVLYTNTGASAAVGVLAIAVALFITLNPAVLEKP
ncbi:MAG TPA: hypothetical protein VF461_00015 [Gemmatimonadaceae bacterium]